MPKEVDLSLVFPGDFCPERADVSADSGVVDICVGYEDGHPLFEPALTIMEEGKYWKISKEDWQRSHDAIRQIILGRSSCCGAAVALNDDEAKKLWNAAEGVFYFYEVINPLESFSLPDSDYCYVVSPRLVNVLTLGRYQPAPEIVEEAYAGYDFFQCGTAYSHGVMELPIEIRERLGESEGVLLRLDCNGLELRTKKSFLQIQQRFKLLEQIAGDDFELLGVLEDDRKRVECQRVFVSLEDASLEIPHDMADSVGLPEEGKLDVLMFNNDNSQCTISYGVLPIAVGLGL